jgi:hypothetical protein
VVGWHVEGRSAALTRVTRGGGWETGGAGQVMDKAAPRGVEVVGWSVEGWRQLGSTSRRPGDGWTGPTIERRAGGGSSGNSKSAGRFRTPGTKPYLCRLPSVYLLVNRPIYRHIYSLVNRRIYWSTFIGAKYLPYRGI